MRRIGPAITRCTSVSEAEKGSRRVNFYDAQLFTSKKSWLRARAIFAKEKPTDAETLSHTTVASNVKGSGYEDGPGSDDE